MGVGEPARGNTASQACTWYAAQTRSSPLLNTPSPHPAWHRSQNSPSQGADPEPLQGSCQPSALWPSVSQHDGLEPCVSYTAMASCSRPSLLRVRKGTRPPWTPQDPHLPGRDALLQGHEAGHVVLLGGEGRGVSPGTHSPQPRAPQSCPPLSHLPQLHSPPAPSPPALCLTRGMMKLWVSSRRCRRSRALCTSDGRFFCTPCREGGPGPCCTSHCPRLPASPAPSRHSPYLEQPFKQCLVAVEVGCVCGVEAWREGTAGAPPFKGLPPTLLQPHRGARVGVSSACSPMPLAAPENLTHPTPDTGTH